MVTNLPQHNIKVHRRANADKQNKLRIAILEDYRQWGQSADAGGKSENTIYAQTQFIKGFYSKDVYPKLEQVLDERCVQK